MTPPFRQRRLFSEWSPGGMPGLEFDATLLNRLPP